MDSFQTNAGVHNATGIEFQKNLALYLFLENFEAYSKQNFFICIEHHDDFLFCFYDENNKISTIDTYQAKKASENWTLTKNFYNIIKKILNVGIDLDKDSIEKVDNYSQNLHFASNTYIDLYAKKTRNRVSETNSKINYQDLKYEIKSKIFEELRTLGIKKNVLDKLNNLNFLYIDFPKASNRQFEQLIGSSTKVFGDKILDHKAAIETLLQLFREVETSYNQGSCVTLLDKRKRVTSEEIFKGINIITTQKKAYSIWRNERNKISSILQIPISKQEEFEKEFNNSFDLFKDKTKTTHINILNFVNQNKDLLGEYYTDGKCIEELFKKYKAEHSSLLCDNIIKAALFAAYVEVKG